jgi:hypothetical protein
MSRSLEFRLALDGRFHDGLSIAHGAGGTALAHRY